MTSMEELLITTLELDLDSNTKAVLLQNFIAEQGPLSEECAGKVRGVLGG